MLPINASNEKKPGTWRCVKESITALGQGYIMHYALCAMHELGHIIAAQAALKAGCTPMKSTEQDPNPSSTKLVFTLVGADAHYPEFTDARINAIINAAGPLCGILGIYGCLKLLNIIIEAQKTNDAYSALKTGLRKNLINEEQPLTTRSAAVLHILANTIGSVPFKNGSFTSDGEKVRLNIAELLNKKNKN